MGLLGSGSKGRSNNRGLKAGGTTPPGVDMLNPSTSGNPDVVHDRAARASAGKMQQRQLSKNKSTGLRAIGRLRGGGKPTGKADPNS